MAEDLVLSIGLKNNPNQTDAINSSEIPNSTEDPVLFEIMKKHGTCAFLNPESPCLIYKVRQSLSKAVYYRDSV